MEVAPYTRLSPAEQSKVQEIREAIDLNDPQAVLQFGLPAQNRIAAFADTLLADVRAKDTGYVGEALNGLLQRVKDVDVDALSASAEGSRIPLIGRFLDSFGRFTQRYRKLSVEIEQILDALERSRMNLLRDVTVLQKMYELNLEYLKQLDLFIAAGEKELEEAQTTVLPVLEAEAAVTRDPLHAQKVADLRQTLNRFEKRLHDLKLSRMVSIQTAPQIRLIQNNNQALVEKIQTSITTTVPLWKNQIIIALTLYRQRRSLELQQEVSKTTNELLAKNAELLRQSSGAVARETERGVVDVETLKKVNDELLATIEETLQIQAEGRVARQAAEVELRRLEDELKGKMIEARR
ncbi:MAG: toxic anion resistance protein [Gaiellales bacterium]|nr:toxic anion resistance protein [Gaiellales bacterium]